MESRQAVGSDPTPHILIFEPDPRGHAREWIGHLLRKAGASQGKLRVSLLIPKDLEETLRPLLPAGAQLLTLDPEEQRRCRSSNLLVSAFGRWRAMRRYLRLSGASRGLFLGFDHLTLPYAFGLGAGGRRVSGILFRPTAHYASLGCEKPSPRERLRDLRKDLLLRLALRNRAVETVFSLDPYFPPFAARRYGAGRKVLPLGDPAAPLGTPTEQEWALARQIPEGRVAFLLFGEITERKGVLPFLEALTLLPPRIAAQTAVTLAGRIDPGVAAQVEELLQRIHQRQPALWLNLADRWITEGEVAALMQASNVVMAPYQRFVGSSGVLLWAARAGRPVICQNYGLLGRLTESYGLGITVDSCNPHALAAAMVKTVEGGAPRLRFPDWVSEFLDCRTPETFAAVLLLRSA